jgi:hypothetical protein
MIELESFNENPKATITNVIAASNVPICNMTFLPTLVRIMLVTKLANKHYKFNMTGIILARLGKTWPTISTP